MTAPCRKCGREGETFELAQEGQVVAVGALCDDCMDQALAELEVLRQQFDELIAAGVDRVEANRIMCARIDGAPTS